MKTYLAMIVFVIFAHAMAGQTAPKIKYLEEVVGGSEAKKIFLSGHVLIKADPAQVAKVGDDRRKEHPENPSSYVLSQINTATIGKEKYAQCMEFKGFNLRPNDVEATYSCTVKTKIE